MLGKRPSHFAAVLVCGLLTAGCGSGGSGTSGSSSSTTATTSTSAATSSAAGTPATNSTSSSTTPSTPTSGATTTTGTTATTGTSPAGSAPSTAAVTQYVAICKSVIANVPKLSATLKARVEGICAKAGNGSEAAAKEAAKEVCVAVIDASPVSAAVKAKSVATCDAEL